MTEELKAPIETSYVADQFALAVGAYNVMIDSPNTIVVGGGVIAIGMNKKVILENSNNFIAEGYPLEQAQEKLMDAVTHYKPFEETDAASKNMIERLNLLLKQIELTTSGSSENETMQ